MKTIKHEWDALGRQTVFHQSPKTSKQSMRGLNQLYCICYCTCKMLLQTIPSASSILSQGLKNVLTIRILQTVLILTSQDCKLVNLSLCIFGKTLHLFLFARSHSEILTDAFYSYKYKITTYICRRQS